MKECLILISKNDLITCFTDVGKYSVGRLRPHFFDVCKPKYEKPVEDIFPNYITNYTCEGNPNIFPVSLQNPTILQNECYTPWKSYSTGREGYKSCNSECASWGLPTLATYNFQTPQVILTYNTSFERSNQYLFGARSSSRKNEF